MIANLKLPPVSRRAETDEMKLAKVLAKHQFRHPMPPVTYRLGLIVPGPIQWPGVEFPAPESLPVLV
jgi:hypothetical protein